MSEVNRLAYSVVKFLCRQLNSGALGPEACESVEVAIQCLQSAYNINEDDSTLDVPKQLEMIFRDYLKELNLTDAVPDATAEAKTEAETLKNEGNNLMKVGKYMEALDHYSRAIKLDPKNEVYYCNRAAAYSRLKNHQAAIEDCNMALKLNPLYSKAYGRLGLAYTSLNDHQRAMESYEKAVNLEPDNATYRNNLLLAEEKVTAESTEMPRSGPIPGCDLSSLLSNPALMSMASQMLADPSMQNMMSTIMAGNVNQPGQGMDALLQAGQQLAQRMQNSNPDLVDQLRRHLGAGVDEPAPPPDPHSDPANKQ